MLEAISIPFLTILLAEFLDKSQLSVLLLATKTKRRLELLIGVMLAFAIVDGSAIVFGSFLTTLIPEFWLRVISGGLFLIFGILSFRHSQEPEAKDSTLTHPLFAGFLMVFFSEWGDKTQLTSALFAARYNPVLVFIGVIAALFILSLLAITLGQKITKKVNPKTIHTIAAFMFILLGAVFIFF